MLDSDVDLAYQDLYEGKDCIIAWHKSRYINNRYYIYIYQYGTFTKLHGIAKLPWDGFAASKLFSTEDFCCAGIVSITHDSQLESTKKATHLITVYVDLLEDFIVLHISASPNKLNFSIPNLIKGSKKFFHFKRRRLSE